MTHAEPISRYYCSQRLRLHYAVWGDEANPPLLLVHGNRDHARTWDQVADITQVLIGSTVSSPW